MGGGGGGWPHCSQKSGWGPEVYGHVHKTKVFIFILRLPLSYMCAEYNEGKMLFWSNCYVGNKDFNLLTVLSLKKLSPKCKIFISDCDKKHFK